MDRFQILFHCNVNDVSKYFVKVFFITTAFGYTRGPLYMQTNENFVDGTRDIINAYTGNFDSDVELSNEWTALDKSVISKPESNGSI